MLANIGPLLLMVLEDSRTASNEQGQTLAEYALVMAGVIALALVVFLVLFLPQVI